MNCLRRISLAFFSSVLTVFLPQSLFAQQCPPLTSNVIVFGGAGSTTLEMKQCYPQFFAVSHDDGSRLIGCLAKQINERNQEKFVIAGHSSGATDAENLMRMINDKTRLKLILLEGFAYSQKQRGPVDTTCWYAQNSALGIKGFNAPSMLNANNCPQPAKAYEDKWCQTPFCLHVAMVNTNVRPDLTRMNVLADGLKNCSGNLDWVLDQL